MAQPHLALEPLDRIARIVAQLGDRGDQSVAENQQRGTVKVGDQPEDEILVPELGEDAVLPVGENRVARFTDHDEGMAGADDPGRSLVVLAARIPEPVIAVARFEIVEETCGIGSRSRCARR